MFCCILNLVLFKPILHRISDNSITSTVADNGSNMVKAFKIYGIENKTEENKDEGDNNKELIALIAPLLDGDTEAELLTELQ